MKGKDWPQQGKPWRTLPGADISPTKLASKASRNLALEYRLRKPRTAARSHAKPPPQKLSKRRLRNPLKRKKNERKRLAPARKTFAHASRGRHIAYTKLASKSSRNLALEYRLRKPRKAARFGPKPCETATTKTLETLLIRNPLKRKKNERKRLAPARKTLAHASRSRHIAYKACLKSVSKSGLGVPPAKASNSSKIRAQAMRNRHHKNSRNVAYETH